jgi:hypothetical protein
VATRAYEFLQLDVFTRNRWPVNPRAVFTDTVPEEKKMVSLVQEINWVLSCHVSPGRETHRREPEPECFRHQIRSNSREGMSGNDAGKY